ncbi:heavy-metal-associated domain-containing protein [Thermocladium modestius]|nr:heavy-metal-associated domain-containing protein [Thermocladium modestius]
MTEKIVKMRVFGMTCDDCVRAVTNGIKSKEGVIDVRVSLSDGSAVVRIDTDKVDPHELEVLPVFTKTRYRAQVREVADS